MTDNRPDRFTEQMTRALHDTDAFAAELRQQMDDSLRPVTDRVIADAVRPWKRMTFWLAVSGSILLAASIVQALVYR